MRDRYIIERKRKKNREANHRNKLFFKATPCVLTFLFDACISTHMEALLSIVNLVRSSKSTLAHLYCFSHCFYPLPLALALLISLALSLSPLTFMSLHLSLSVISLPSLLLSYSLLQVPVLTDKPFQVS